METLCLAEQYILRHTVYRNDLMKRCCPDLQIPQILMSVGSSGLTSPIDVNSILQLIGHEVYAYVLLTVHCTLKRPSLGRSSLFWRCNGTWSAWFPAFCHFLFVSHLCLLFSWSDPCTFKPLFFVRSFPFIVSWLISFHFLRVL